MNENEESVAGSAWGLIMAFPDQSPSFAHGFAAGKIWADMKRNDQAELSFDVAQENRDVVYRMAAALGWSVECQPMTGEFEGWNSLTLTKIGPERKIANPHGFRVV